MARGTRERFDRWAGFLPPSQGITGPGEPHRQATADNENKPCTICGRLMREHSWPQLFACRLERDSHAHR